MDNELLLFDRIEVIKKTVEKYGQENFCLSFSGGKDSTVLHYLIDLAIPDNRIPRVFINTGIEYQLIVDFVKKLSKTDDRFITIYPRKKIIPLLEEVGYPFKSKEHSQLVGMYQENGHSNTTLRYVNPPKGRERFGCPKCLKYQFEKTMDFKISKKCCDELKKKPFNKYQDQYKKPYKLTGERKDEGGLRSIHGDCLQIDKNGNLKKFKPLNPMNDEWINWLVENKNIKLCDLYYEPYNFKRTGCCGCPYNIHIQNDLEMMKELLPCEYFKANHIWKPVYEEYKRIGYRIKKEI